MARIILSPDKPVAASFLKLAANIVAVSNQATRLRGVADQITNNSAQPANLESSTEATFPAGTGAALNTGLTQIKTALDGLATLVSSIDQGA